MDIVDRERKKVVKVLPVRMPHNCFNADVGRCPNWIAISPDGRYVAVSNSGSDDCSIIDARTLREVTRVKVGKGP